MDRIKSLVELAEHVVQNTAVLEVGNLWVSIEPASDNDRLASVSLNGDVLANLQVSTVDVNREGLSSIKPVRVSTFSALELEWQDAHTNQVASMDSLVAQSNDDGDGKKKKFFGCPIPRRARSIVTSSKDYRLFA